MGERTEISWADSTFNPVVGCTKVSAACDHCYAESWAKRAGQPELWQGERRRTTPENWRKPLKWDRDAALSGRRPRVFCASLSDVFDNQWEPEWRRDLWQLIAETPHLDWLLLTKRPQNIAKMLPSGDLAKFLPWPWPNVWLGTTAENQTEANRRVPHLVAVPAAVRFLSCEPLLGPINLALAGLEVCLNDFDTPCTTNISWVISGGESGSHHRQTDPAWIRSLRDQCYAVDIAFHHKQNGGKRPKDGGCLLDGREHKEFPRMAA